MLLFKLKQKIPWKHLLYKLIQSSNNFTEFFINESERRFSVVFTLWKLRKFTATILSKKFRQINFFTKELYSKLIWPKKDLRDGEFHVFPHYCVCYDFIEKFREIKCSLCIFSKLISQKLQSSEILLIPHCVCNGEWVLINFTCSGKGFSGLRRIFLFSKSTSINFSAESFNAWRMVSPLSQIFVKRWNLSMTSIPIHPSSLLFSCSCINLSRGRL